MTEPRGEGLRVEISRLAGHTNSRILKEPLKLQCPALEPFAINYGYNANEWQTVFDGSYSRSGGAKLIVVQFETLFVEEDPIWVVEHGDYDIESAQSTLRKLSEGAPGIPSGQPFKLLCTHGYKLTPEISMNATLESYNHTEKEPFTFYADLTFKQWRDPTASSDTHNRVGSKTWPKHHMITDTDTLYSLAIKYYGKASEARTIANANHMTTSDFTRKIHEIGGKWKKGAIILIPKPIAKKAAKKPQPTVVQK